MRAFFIFIWLVINYAILFGPKRFYFDSNYAMHVVGKISSIDIDNSSIDHF